MFSLQSTAFAFLVLFAATSNAFTVLPSTNAQRSVTSLNGFGDAFKNAFASDDSLGKAQNAGLSGGPKTNDNVSINGKKVNAIVGQKVSVVAASARVKISYNCNKGDCGTCNVKINGRVQKACQQIVPAGKCNIQTL
mmetsp:Transcript_5027/g.7423  ORF Transcript_5027/g.7423 Transcript_5027/m.7423 type:complete len:137 (+) Transcript_5027:116-526(+)